MGWGSLGPLTAAQRRAFFPRARDRTGVRPGFSRGMSNAQFNRMKRGVYADVASKMVVEVLGESQVSNAFDALNEKVRIKVIQNAIKPIVRESKNVWKREIKSARASGRSNAFRRRYGGTSLRAALAKAVKSKNPSGRGEKSLRGYAFIGSGSTNHGKRGQATTNTGQMMWLEWGTKPHALGANRQHPGSEPVTKVRKAMRALAPKARRVFAEAVRMGMKSPGEKITAQQGRAMFKRLAA